MPIPSLEKQGRVHKYVKWSFFYEVEQLCGDMTEPLPVCVAYDVQLTTDYRDNYSYNYQ